MEITIKSALTIASAAALVAAAAAATACCFFDLCDNAAGVGTASPTSLEASRQRYREFHRFDVLLRHVEVPVFLWQRYWGHHGRVVRPGFCTRYFDVVTRTFPPNHIRDLLDQLLLRSF